MLFRSPAQTRNVSSVYFYIDDVAVVELPKALNYKKDTTVCTLPLPLTANVGFSSYYWNTGDTTRSITATHTGKYWVRGSLDDCGDVTDTLYITQKMSPTLAVADTLLCDTQLPLTYNLLPNTAAYLAWSTGAIGNSATISKAGSYQVTATNECGSTTAAFVVATQTPLPPMHLSFSDTTSCLNGHFLPVTLRAPTGYPNYHWSTHETTRIIVAYKADTYTLRSENLCGESSANPTCFCIFSLCV